MRKILLLIFIGMIFANCSPIETARVLDLTLKPFRDHGKIYSEDIPKDIYTCYQETTQTLKEMSAIPLRGTVEKRFLVAIGFDKSFGTRCSDTTEVAIFFTPINFGKDTPLTKIEVSSLNYPLSKFAAEKLFAALKGEGGEEEEGAKNTP